MKNNKVKLYAKALAEVLSKKGINEEKVTKNFLELLIKTGQEKKAKEILSLAEDFVLKAKGGKKIVIETARRLTAENKTALKKFIKEGDVVEEKIDNQLIAGVKIIMNNEKQFDNSMQKKLQEIF